MAKEQKEAVEKKAKSTTGLYRKKGKNSAQFKHHPASGTTNNGPISRSFQKLYLPRIRKQRYRATVAQVKAAIADGFID